MCITYKMIILLANYTKRITKCENTAKINQNNERFSFVESLKRHKLAELMPETKIKLQLYIK